MGTAGIGPEPLFMPAFNRGKKQNFFLSTHDEKESKCIANNEGIYYLSQAFSNPIITAGR